MRLVRLGLIGCGRIARAVHLPILQRISGAQIVALAEPIESSRVAAAELAPGASLFNSWQELIDRASIDAVVICLPPHLHAPCAIAAFSAGLHVYLEKPLAPTLAASERVIAEWQRAGTVGMIGFNFRFHPQVIDVRERIRTGAIGRPIAVRSVFSILPHTIPEWKRALNSGGGALLDLGSHHTDIACYILDDKAERAFASARSLQGEHDNAALQLEMSSGVVMQTFVSLGGTEEHRIEIFGTGGKLVVDRTELLRPLFMPATLRGARFHRILRAISALDPRLLLRSPGVESSFQTALATFVHAAAGGSFSGPDLADGARSLAMIEAAQRSVTTGMAMPASWEFSAPGTPALAAEKGQH